MAAQTRRPSGSLSSAERQAIAQLTARHGAHNVRVFGSLARGNAEDASDLDLLINLDPGSTLLDLVAIKQDIEEATGLAVDVLTEGSLSPYIREQVLTDARPF